MAALAMLASVASLGWVVRGNRVFKSQFVRDAAESTAQRTEVGRQVKRETERVATAEKRVAELLQAAKAPAVGPMAARISTASVLKEAMEKAQALIEREEYLEALDEYVRCYREVRAVRPGSSECQTLSSAILGLAQKYYPPARDAVVRLRDAATADFLAKPEQRELSFESALLNERLGESYRTLALFDRLPPNDIGRQSVAMVAFDAFVEARRYSDALVGRNAGQLMSRVEAGLQALPKVPEEYRDQTRENFLGSAFVAIEVLTGAGRLHEARIVTEKLLAFDGSEAVRAAIREHVTRAQQ